MTFYRKYRPQTIEELDLQNVRESLSKILSDRENMPHAFLFAGPRGSGKTSAARIMSKVINCENPKTVDGVVVPCNECSACKSIENGQSMDVIELDAASNRGIDDIRSIRESVKLAPAVFQKKIYILDEAHMLTLDAANAFLKTLEEPPSHVIFILATTDPQKLPETVRSRLTLVQFKKATGEEIKRQLTRVADSEKLNIEEGVIELIANASDGSFREAVKILESLNTGGSEILLAETKQMLLGKNSLVSNGFFECLADHDLKGILEKVEEVSAGGVVMKDQQELLLRRLQSALLYKSGIASGDDIERLSREDIVRLIECILESQKLSAATSIDQLPLEIALSKWMSGGRQPIVETPKKKLTEAAGPVNSGSDAKQGSQMKDGVWGKILHEMHGKNASVETLLRAAKPLGIDGNTLKLGVYYRFHKERLETGQYRSLLESVASDILGVGPVRIECCLEERDTSIHQQSPESIVGLTGASDHDIIQAAKEIFGN